MRRRRHQRRRRRRRRRNQGSTRQVPRFARSLWKPCRRRGAASPCTGLVLTARRRLRVPSRQAGVLHARRYRGLCRRRPPQRAACTTASRWLRRRRCCHRRRSRARSPSGALCRTRRRQSFVRLRARIPRPSSTDRARRTERGQSAPRRCARLRSRYAATRSRAATAAWRAFRRAVQRQCVRSTRQTSHALTRARMTLSIGRDLLHLRKARQWC